MKTPECTRPFSVHCIVFWVPIPRAPVFFPLFCEEEEEESPGASGPFDSLQCQGFPKGHWGDMSPIPGHAVVQERSSENVWLADLCLKPLAAMMAASGISPLSILAGSLCPRTAVFIVEDSVPSALPVPGEQCGSLLLSKQAGPGASRVLETAPRRWEQLRPLFRAGHLVAVRNSWWEGSGCSP